MNRAPVSRLSNEALLRELKASVAHDCSHTARQVELIAEVDKRKLYLPAGYESMFAYCVGELNLSEDAAYKRIHVARAARRCPAVLAALRDGRVHLSGLTVMARYLNSATADELLEAATHKRKSEIERLVAERFPRPDVPAFVRAIPQPSAPAQPESVTTRQSPEGLEQAQPVAKSASELAPAQVQGHVILGQLAAPAAPPPPAEQRGRVTPLAPQRFAFQCTLGQEGRDLLRYAQELLSHRVPSGDLEEVMLCLLKAAIPRLEKDRFAATDRPRAARRPEPGSRHIPAHVKRAVWARDGGRCTFVSENGRRCEARRQLEFDHMQEFARGGDARVPCIRLRCRATISTKPSARSVSSSCGTNAPWRRGREPRRRRGRLRRQHVGSIPSHRGPRRGRNRAPSAARSRGGFEAVPLSDPTEMRRRNGPRRATRAT